MKDVLCIAYHYPPMVAGASRAKGLVQHIPEFGYRPHVLTTTTYGQASHPQVYRAHELLGVYRQVFNDKQKDLSPVQRSFERTNVRGVRGVVRQLKRLAFIPDGQVGWLPHALWVGLQLIRQHSIQVIYSTAPPFSAHLLAALLQRLSGLPWVADFRDTWTYDPLDEALQDFPMRLRIERWLEQKVVNQADRVVAVTDVACEDFASRYPNRQDRLVCIPNGFEPSELSQAQSVLSPDEDVLRLVYTGSFSYSHPLRSPKPFFDAVTRLLAEFEGTQKLEIVIVGALSAQEQEDARDLVNAGVVQLVGAVSRQEAVAWQRRAHVLLLVDHDRGVPASNIPGKCYEYLASQKPILALVPQGATRRLIERLGAGLCVMPNDVAGIVEALTHLLNAPSLDAWGVPGNQLRAFEQRTTARNMAACFDGIVKTQQKNP